MCSHKSSMSIIIIIPVIAATQGIQHKEPKPVLPSYLESCFFMLGKLSPNDRTIQVSDFFKPDICVWNFHI